MKKEISLIIKKTIPFCLFLFAFSPIHSMGSVRKLPVQYYVTKKTTGPLQTKTSEKTTPLPVKFFDIKSKNDHLIQVSQEILELSKTIKDMLEDLRDTPEIPIPLEDYSRDTLITIFNNILPQYKKNPETIGLYLENICKHLTLEQLIDVTNTLNFLDIRALDNPETPAPLLSIFTKKIFDIITDFTPGELTAHTKIIAALHSDLKKSLIEYVIPCLKNRMIQLYGNDTNRRRTLLEESFICIAFSPDGTRFVTGDLDNLIVRDTQTSQEIKRIKGHFTNVVFSPDGIHIIATRNIFNWAPHPREDGLLIVYNAETLETIHATTIPQNIVTTLAISPDGTKIACGVSPNKSLIIWDTFTLQEIANFKDHSENIATIAFSPDSKQMVSGSEHESIDNLILWNMQTYQKITNFNNYSNYVESVKFSPDGRRIIVGGYGKNPAYEEGKNVSYFLADLTVWDSKTHQEIISLHDVEGRNLSTVSFSPDGTYIASGNSWEILSLRNAQTFEKIIDLDVQVPITNLVFSPDGKEIFYSNSGSRGRRGLFVLTLLTEDIQALNDFKISDSAASINATILIHKLCSAIEKGVTIDLSPEESDVFNTLPDFVKKLLKNDTPKQALEKPASSISIQPTDSTQDLGRRITITDKPVTTAPSFMQTFDIYAEKFMRWLRSKSK